ncbi:MAG: serine/threonine protein kinase [Candidatus Xenobiia bacterium LiM19]
MSSPLPAGTALKGRYVIEGLIGQGGMACVYSAKDSRLQNARWAVKEMNCYFTDPEELDAALAQFRSEAELLTGLSHRNLPKVADFFEEAGRYYLVMEYIEGVTLDVAVSEYNGFIPEEMIRKWMVQLCDCLEYLHGHNPPVIFRDLKPGNVIVMKDGTIRLIDFGIARVFVQGRQKDTLILGTPGYAPPEQYGRAQTDARSDIYSLGATLYYILTRDDPGLTPLSFKVPSSVNPAITPLWDSVVLKALSLSPDDRYQSVIEMRDAFSGRATTMLAHQAVPSQVFPIPAVTPGSLSLSLQSKEQHVTGVFTVENRGGGTLVASLSANRKWVSFLPSHFSSNHQAVEVSADLRGEKRDAAYRATIFLEWDGGSVEVPLRVNRERQWWEESLSSKVTSASLFFIGLVPFVGIPGSFATYFLLDREERYRQHTALGVSTIAGAVSTLLTYLLM